MDNTQKKLLKNQALMTWNSEKIKLSDQWIDNEVNQRNRTMSQRAIYLCNLGENIGSEQCKLRPVLIVSNNKINKGNNVIVVPLSTKIKTITNKKGKEIPRYKTHYFLTPEKYPFLSEKSVAKCEHITTVSKVRLTSYFGMIDEDDFNKIMIRINSNF